MISLKAFDIRMFIEKQVYKFWASFSKLEIEQLTVTPILSVKTGLRVNKFYEIYGASDILAESLIFKPSVSRLVNKVYGKEDREIKIFISSRSGYRFEYMIKKNTKTCKYEDYRRLCYLLRYTIVVSSTRRWERKLAKKICKYCLKDWKEIEKHGEFCF